MGGVGGSHLDFIVLEGLTWISGNSNGRFPSSNRICLSCTRHTNMSVLECYGIMIYAQHTLIRKAAGISSSSLAKLGKNEVTTDVLLKICESLHAELSDIVESVHDEDDDSKDS